MPKLQVTLLIVVLLCLVVWTGYGQGQRSGPVRQNWEYRVVETQFLESYTPAGDVQQILNQGGAEGWELVRIEEKRYYFKRPK
jgi:hypothetical protein